MRSIIDRLAEHPTTLTLVGSVGSVVFGSGLQLSWGHWTMLLWLVGILLSVGVPTIGSRLNRLQQGRRAALRCIKNALAACGAAHGYPERHVRVNVMLLNRNGRRRVDMETAFNMAADPDCDLEIDATAGVSGEAYRSRVPVYGDLGLALQPGGPTWGLRDAERARVRNGLKSILSVPLFDPDDPDGLLLGTLQVDSDRTIAEMEFERPERRAVVERFSDVIALLMKAGQ